MTATQNTATPLERLEQRVAALEARMTIPRRAFWRASLEMVCAAHSLEQRDHEHTCYREALDVLREVEPSERNAMRYVQADHLGHAQCPFCGRVVTVPVAEVVE